MTKKLPLIALLCLISTSILAACTATPTATTITTTTAVPTTATLVASAPTLPHPTTTITTTTATTAPLPTTTSTTTTTVVPTTTTTLSPTTTSPEASLGEPVVLGDWSVKVTDYDPDATREILEYYGGNNDEPDNDNRYVMVTVEVTNISETKKPLSFEVGFQGIDRNGKLYEECESVLIPDGYRTGVELIPGSTSEGDICFEVADKVASSLRLVVAQSGILGDDYAIVELSTTDTMSSTTTTVIKATADTLLLSCATEISEGWADARNASLRVAESFAEDSRAAAEEVENSAWELISGATEALDCLLGTQPGDGPERFDEAFRQFRTGNTELPTTALLLGCATEITGTWDDAQLTALRIVEWIDEASQAASDRMEGATVDLAVGVAGTLDCLLGTQPGDGTGRIDAALQQLR